MDHELVASPSPATDHDEGSPRVLISGLNRTAFDLAVYASQGWSPHPPRKTRFRLLVRLYRTGLVTRRVPSERFQVSDYPPFPSFLGRGQTDLEFLAE